MKRIGKSLLIILMLFMYIGIIYFGVVAVIWDTQRGMLLHDFHAMNDADKLRFAESIKQSIGEVSVWIEEEVANERKLLAYVDEQLSNMTIEQKLAQMMILTNENDITAENLRQYQPGGIIFFKVDFSGKTREEVRNRVENLQSYMEIPLLVGMDEEGGAVSRLDALKEAVSFAGARELYQKGKDAIREDTGLKMELLKDMGINLNFAPVADVVEQKSSYMYSRSASGDADEVAEYVKTVLTVMQEHQVMECMKHFPGYGENINTHNNLAKDSRKPEEYEEKDFIPFRAGIKEGVDMIMVSHIIMESVDSRNPASLSKKVHEILRKDLEFQGIVIADDLNMQAILNTWTIKDATVKAFLAGNDMIFSADFAASMKGATNAVTQGELPIEQVDDSVRRILRMKIKNGIKEM